MTAHHWLPGELDRLQLSIGQDGTGDTACEVCGRWIGQHEPEALFCSPSAQRYPGPKRSPANPQYFATLADTRREYVRQFKAWPQHTHVWSSTYGWVLNLQVDPSAKLAACDLRAAPVRLQVAA